MSRQEYVDCCRAENKEDMRGMKFLITYIREDGIHPSGVVVAFRYKGEEHSPIYLGWSKCSPRDKYNKHVGLAKAFAKAVPVNYYDEEKLTSIRESARSWVIRMMERSRKYFRVGEYANSNRG